MDLNLIKLILEITIAIITIIGAPIAIYLYFKDKRKERLDREYGTYNALDDKYIDFLNICLENIDLGIYEMSEKKDKEFSNEQLIRKKIIFEILICLFERAYLMYKNQDTAVRKKQWLGWNSYMEDWMKVKSFRKAWNSYLNSQYDVNFLNHMNQLYNQKKV